MTNSQNPDLTSATLTLPIGAYLVLPFEDGSRIIRGVYWQVGVSNSWTYNANFGERVQLTPITTPPIFNYPEGYVILQGLIFLLRNGAITQYSLPNNVQLPENITLPPPPNLNTHKNCNLFAAIVRTFGDIASSPSGFSNIALANQYMQIILGADATSSRGVILNFEQMSEDPTPTVQYLISTTDPQILPSNFG